MKIQVLGSGCHNCKKLYELTQQAVKELNMNEEVEYIFGVPGEENEDIMISLINSKMPLVAMLHCLTRLRKCDQLQWYGLMY